MRITITSVLTVLFLALSIETYSVDKIIPDFEQIITNRFSKLWINTPQEKIYIQTDKPYYSAGEDIWFKGYLLNATTMEPNALSQFIYIELIDQSDSVFYRIKIKKSPFGFDGHIKLKPDIHSGYYTLRAYTYWMQNTSEDFFYRKNILIGNAIDDRIMSKITYGKVFNGMIPVTLLFTDASHNPISGKRFEIIQMPDNNMQKKMTLVTNNTGTINWVVPYNSTDHSKKSIRVTQPEEKYTSEFIMPVISQDFDVQFFPESGVLLNNNLQCIAFKAIGIDGLSVDITGKIFSNNNEEISEISTLNKGMGKFSINTQPGESYYAIVKTANGNEKRIELPKTEAEAVAIRLVYNRRKILYEVINQTGLQDKVLYLMIHSRGKVFAAQSLKSLHGQISKALLPPGIVSFSVIDTLGHTYCERLSFVNNYSVPIISLDSVKPAYGKREKVNLNLNIHSVLKLPVAGSFSISITDSHTVKFDSLSDNIMSYLLLSSDIKGYIEDPASYFKDDKIITGEKTDVLMMTQGWHRFNTGDIVNAVYKQHKYFLEEGQALGGKVLNFFGKPSKKSDIIMISPYKNLVRTAVTDSLGHYLIDNIEFPDSTSFVLKAKKPKSLTDVEIVPDQDVFPKPGIMFPIPLNKNVTAQEDYFNQIKEKYYYEGGIRAINLREIIVKAEKKPEVKKEYYSGMADNEINTDRLDQYPGMSVLNLLYTVPGIQVSGNKISIRGNPRNPLILLDNIEMQDIQDISYLTSNDVESIQVFKGISTSIFGSRGANGVIAITLRKDIILKATTPISLVNITPLGYQKPSEFYVPKYEVDSVLKNHQPDLRTTIYWNPKLVADSNGTIHVTFYTADNASDYSIVLEGITDKGEICRYIGSLKRESN